MPITAVNPYIHFNGTAAQAIELYRSALGARTEVVLNYEGSPLILHASLRIGANPLMLNDTTPGQPVPTEGNMQIALDFTDEQEMTEAFDALSEGGSVLVPLHDEFWGAKFGIVNDRLGVRWLFNCAQTKGKQ